jgi:fatty acid desaturase
MLNERIFDEVDYEGFARNVKALHDELRADTGAADLAHLRRIEIWGRVCSVLGYATAWIVPNPIAAILIGQGIFIRMAIMHQVMHGAYDRIPGVAAGYTSACFAKGWRRYLDFMDWVLPAAWKHEHNAPHHYHLSEMSDPDFLELNTEWLRRSRAPRALKYLLIGLCAMVWKWYCMVPKSMCYLHDARCRRARLRSLVEAPEVSVRRAALRRAFNPLTCVGFDVWFRCLVPYVLARFVVIPLLFLPLGGRAVFCVLLTSVMAELWTNLHSFIVIIPNHSGEDLYRFDGPISDRADFYLRGVVGSVNYRTGGDFNDFLYGFLNYHIEHHLWPDLSFLRYQQAQGRLKRLCEQYGLPYVQESIFERFKHMLRIVTGETSMRLAVTLTRQERIALEKPVAVTLTRQERIALEKPAILNGALGLALFATQPA